MANVGFPCLSFVNGLKMKKRNSFFKEIFSLSPIPMNNKIKYDVSVALFGRFVIDKEGLPNQRLFNFPSVTIKSCG